jgi:hypothetical protein
MVPSIGASKQREIAASAISAQRADNNQSSDMPLALMGPAHLSISLRMKPPR